MPQSAQYRTIIEIINNCFRRLGLDPVSAIDSTRMSNMALGLVNDVLDDLAGYGDWQEAYREVVVTCAASVNRYKVAAVSATTESVKNILGVYFGNQTVPLNPVTLMEIVQFTRATAHGTPRHFCIQGVSGADPLIRVYPTPATTATGPFSFMAHYYAKHRVLVTADASVVPMYNAKLVEQGLYVKLLLEEAAGEPNPIVQINLAEYEQKKKEEMNRFTYDTGDDHMQFYIGH
ncbi:MAG TPA: hypothetical protein VLS45_06490 [Methylomicrobium sp.]|nr:hypothetical protein [Methylomicrobium sp.]